MFRDPEREKIRKSWEGKSVSELEAHPFFSKIPLKRKESDGEIELRNYEEPGTYRSRANCASLGGCIGIGSGACQNIFTIKKGVISQYEMRESCLTDKRKYP